jgi:hypothetical protein
MEQTPAERKIFQSKSSAVHRQKRNLDGMPGTPPEDILSDSQPLDANPKEHPG